MNMGRLVLVSVWLAAALGCGGSSANLISGLEAGSSSGASSDDDGSSASASSGSASTGADASGASTSGSGAGASGESDAALGAMSSGATSDAMASSGSSATDSGPGASGMSSSGMASSGMSADAGTASTACKTYCAAIQGACVSAGDQQYADDAECLAACALLESATLPAGNTLACRTTHAGYAVATPYPHCWHAGPYGFSVCGDECASFCALAAKACPTAYGQGGCEGRCMSYAKAAAPDTAGATGVYTASGPKTGNTLDCREYYLGEALQGTAAACADVAEVSSHCK
jgi:hypothetical protein